MNFHSTLTLKMFMFLQKCLSVKVISLLKEMFFFANFRNYAENERDNEAIFTCAGFSIAIIWRNNSLFVIDSHSPNADG